MDRGLGGVVSGRNGSATVNVSAGGSSGLSSVSGTSSKVSGGMLYGCWWWIFRQLVGELR